MKGLATIVVAIAVAAATLLAVGGALAQPCDTDADCVEASRKCIGPLWCWQAGHCIEHWCSYYGSYSCVCDVVICGAQCFSDDDCIFPKPPPPCSGPPSCVCGGPTATPTPTGTPPTATPTPTPTPPVVGGVAELPATAATQATGSGSPAPTYLALAGFAAAAVLALTAGAWYARRRWVR